MFRDNKIRGAAHLEAKAKRLEQELSTLKSATPQVGSEEVKRREDQLKRRTKEVDDLTKRIEALRDQYEGEKNKNKSLQEELDHLQNDHRSLQANSTKERDVLLQRLHDTEEQLKGFESVREAVTNMNLYSEAERTRQSTSVLPSAVYPDLSYSELNASTSSITSSATDSEDHVIGLWKLLPEEIRRKFAEFAISDTGRTTSVAKCIKRLKKLTLKLDIERQTFQVRAPRSGDSTLSLTQSIESVHSKEKKVLRNAATDCSGLYVPIFDHSMTPRNSQDSLFLENVAGPPRVPSRERILLEEIGATGKVRKFVMHRCTWGRFQYTHTVADEVNNAISKSVEIRPVSVSIQAEEGQTVEKLLEENLVQKRTIDNLRADLGMKNADIDDLLVYSFPLCRQSRLFRNKQLDELNGLIDELEEENKRDKERNQSFELENERLVREKEEFRSECEKLAEKVCRLEEDAQLYQRQIEEDDAKAKDVENRLDELENAALTRKPLEEELRKLALRNSELEFEVKKVTKEYEKLKERHSKVKKDMNESFDRMERFQEEQIKKIKVLQMGNYEREKFIKTIRKRILRLCKFVKKHHPSDETLLTELDAISSGCSRQDKGLIGSES
ncbi:hypothetical protein QR680_009831 [Steinernema hermaphroditum]|uniref:Uncharacterized protein n=1 Tax=Steinernema hermaphroditum TaxID=289476 RepID=A0AA39MAG0_9BILA|nr:hypothetical protein QR680_009831 [Steinernema hermaphroditum]